MTAFYMCNIKSQAGKVDPGKPSSWIKCCHLFPAPLQSAVAVCLFRLSSSRPSKDAAASADAGKANCEETEKKIPSVLVFLSIRKAIQPYEFKEESVSHQMGEDKLQNKIIIINKMA